LFLIVLEAEKSKKEELISDKGFVLCSNIVTLSQDKCMHTPERETERNRERERERKWDRGLNSPSYQEPSPAAVMPCHDDVSIHV
jgi:hypothetical protein